jgi:hypothetical protein
MLNSVNLGLLDHPPSYRLTVGATVDVAVIYNQFERRRAQSHAPIALSYLSATINY